MASPIIDSIEVVPAVIAPGETAVVTIVAHDPDGHLLTYTLEDASLVGFTITPRAAATGVLTGSVTDIAGNVTQATALLTVGQAHIFDVTAP